MRAYGDQNMSWQGLRDVARGQTRYWPDGRVNAVYPNDDGPRHIPIFTERYPEWVWRYYVATGDRGTALSLYPSTQKVADYIWAARDAATGLLNGFAEGNNNSDPVFGYDQSVTLDTTSNVLGVNAFNRIAQLAVVAGDTAGATTQMARRPQLTGAINSQLARPDGIYTDGLLPGGAQSAHASQEANALALAYGVVPAPRVAAVGAYVAGLGIAVGPVHGLELLRGLANAGLGAGHGPHPDRHRHTGLGPHRGLRRHLHLGNLDTERSHRRLDVAWVGLLRPGRHARNAAGRHPASPRRRRDGRGHHRSPEDGVARGPRHGPDRSPDRSRSRGATIERSSRSPPSSRPMRPPGSPSRRGSGVGARGGRPARPRGPA